MVENTLLKNTLYALRFSLNSVWGPVEWVGDQLTGWGGSSQKQNLKINGHFFFIFSILATDTEISVRNTFGDQLNGLGTS